MKNIYKILGVMTLLILLGRVDVKSQGANYTIFPSQPCDQQQTTLVADTSGLNPLPWNTVVYWIIDNQTYLNGPTVNYTFNYGWHNVFLVINDSSGGIFTDTTFSIFSDSACYGNVASGKVYFDLNSNGIFDSSDIGAINAPINITKPGFNFNISTNGSGDYEINLDTGSYTISFSNSNNYYQLTQPTSSNSYAVGFTGVNGSSTGNDFGIFTDSVANDLEVHISNSPLRPGFGGRLYVYARNKGSIPAVGNIQLFLDPILDFDYAVPPADSSNTGVVYLTTPPLAPNQSSFFRIEVKIDSTVALGTIVKSEAFIFPIIDDVSPANNWDSLSATIVGSYDPNDKLVFPSDDSSNIVLPNDPVTYTIRFQNTGTFFAQNVKIKDYIEPNLDLNTIQFLAGSHSYTTEVRNNGWVIIKFDDIMLPAEQNNEPESHGFIKFRIYPQAGLPLGTVLNNTAEIYFDFNQPIITNTISSTIDTLNTFVSISSEGIRNSNEISIYPNPFDNTLHVHFNNEDLNNIEISIYSINGQSIKTIKTSNPNNSIDLSDIKSGLYLYKVKSNERILENGKLMKY